MKISISQSTMDKIYDHAIKEYPRECCGWIIESPDQTHTYIEAENLQDKYHKLDPEAYPRTSKDAFLMDSLKLSRAIEEAAKSGGSLFSIVHSHIDCGAYFSAEDEIQMSTPDRSEPIFPANCYIVVSVQEGKPSENAAFVFDPASKKYQKAEFVVQ